ncbi:hypothetical protein ABPG77_000892 [Micractinium sp. CCAP 211/92]
MIFLAGALLARQALPALGRLAKRLAPVYAANRLLLVTSLAASAGTAGAPPLLAAAVQRGATLAVVGWLTRARRQRRAVTPSGTCGGTSGDPPQKASGLQRRARLLLIPLLLAVDAAQKGGSMTPSVAVEIALRTSVGTATYGAKVLHNLAGLAAIRLLLCCRSRVPYTERTALLPRPWLEWCFNHTAGLASNLVYPSMAFAEELQGLQGLLSIVCLPHSLETAVRHQGRVRAAHARLLSAAERAAVHAGRPLLTTPGASASLVPITSINAVCCPGGHVFVHSGLINAVRGKPEAVTFVVGHEVGHALARHAAERMMRALMESLGISVVVGGVTLLANAVRHALIKQGRQRDAAAWRRRHPLLRIFPPSDRRQRAARKATRPLVEYVNLGADIGLNVAAFLASLATSREAEHEADFLALYLAHDAGMPGAMEGAEAMLAVRQPWWGLSWLLPTFLSTHPSSKQRLRLLRRRERLVPFVSSLEEDKSVLRPAANVLSRLWESGGLAQRPAPATSFGLSK